MLGCCEIHLRSFMYALQTYIPPFSSPEAALLSVSTKNRDLWSGPTPVVRDSRTSRHSAHAQGQVWQIWLAEYETNSLRMFRKSDPAEVAILGADQRMIFDSRKCFVTAWESLLDLRLNGEPLGVTFEVFDSRFEHEVGFHVSFLPQAWMPFMPRTNAEIE